VYGLSDAGVAWYECISAKLSATAWQRLPEDPCIFVKGGKTAVLYVDDLLVSAISDSSALREITDLGFELGKGRPLKSGDEFAGVVLEFEGTSFSKASDVRISQRKYTLEELPDPVWERKAPTPLPVTLAQRDYEQEKKLNAAEHRVYRGMVGKLLWLANTTRPDLAYAAAYLSRALAGPTDRDFQLADRCIAYAKSTADYCLVIPKINWDKAQLTVITDASWAAPRDDYKSQSGYLILLHDHLRCGLLAWKSTMLRKMAGSNMASECFSAQSGHSNCLELASSWPPSWDPLGLLPVPC